MAQRISGYDRVADDRYETPPEITATIVPYLQRQSAPLVRRIWEPAHSPADKLGNALRAAGFKVFSTDDDFLKYNLLPDVDALVTNPPYGKQGKTAEAFIRHALNLKVPHVALLLPVDFDSALTRAPLFGECRKYFNGKIVLLRRIKWFPGDSGPSTNHAWFLWRQGGVMPWISYATPVKPQQIMKEAAE